VDVSLSSIIVDLSLHGLYFAIYRENVPTIDGNSAFVQLFMKPIIHSRQPHTYKLVLLKFCHVPLNSSDSSLEKTMHFCFSEEIDTVLGFLER
jgi:hypothetical protein